MYEANPELSITELAGCTRNEAAELEAERREELELADVAGNTGFADERYDSMDDAPADVQAEWALWDARRNEDEAKRASLLAFFGGEDGDDDPTPPAGSAALVALLHDDELVAVCVGTDDEELLAAAADEIDRRLTARRAA